MKYLAAVVISLALGAVAAADWVRGGDWGYSPGDSQGIAVAPNGNVYVDISHDRYMAYYTPAGAPLGSWYMEEPLYN